MKALLTMTVTVLLFVSGCEMVDGLRKDTIKLLGGTPEKVYAEQTQPESEK